MTKTKFLFTFIFFLCSGELKATAVLDYNQNCKRAYQAVFSLKFAEAKSILDSERKSNPQNVVPYVIDNISDCLYLFISENKSDFENYKIRMDDRLEKVEELDENSPYYLYCKAGIYFQWAVVRIKFGEYYTAALHFRKAYKMFEQNAETHKEFLPGNIYLGLMHAAIGAVPEQYKWLASLVGFKGTLQQGVAELEQVANLDESSEFYYQKNEALMALASVQLTLQKNQTEARKIAEKLYRIKRSPVTSFLLADVLLHSGDNDDAITVIENVPRGGEYFHIYYFDYLMGLAKLNRMDEDANIFLEKYLNEFKGMHYFKAALQKLAWFHFLKGDIPKYRKLMDEIKITGNEYVDEDKQAQVEAEAAEIPNKILLRARLYFDGGYYSKALAQFKGSTLNDFPTLKNQLEVTYRVARIYHKLGETQKAIEKYQETLKNGYNMSFYFAANSALQLGLIYEDNKDFVKAEFYFRKCLSMRRHEYQNSLDQKAKAGLARVTGK